MALHQVAGRPDEGVVHGGGEVFRLPRTPAAAARLQLLVRVLPRLRPLVPVPVPAPRLRRGARRTGRRRSPASRGCRVVPPAGPLSAIAAGQLAGLLAALAEVPVREAVMWGVPAGEGVLLHGGLTRAALLVDPQRGVLSGVVGWDPRLGDPAADLAGLDPALRAALA